MYIDAGTGRMLLQAGAAVFFTALVFCKEIFRFFHKRKSSGEKDAQ